MRINFFIFLAALLVQCQVGIANEDQKLINLNLNSEDLKKNIEDLKEKLQHDKYENKGKLLVDLAILYLKDQSEELAFDTFLEALNKAPKLQLAAMTKEEVEVYEKALNVYLMPIRSSIRDSAKEIIKNYASFSQYSSEASPLSFFLALAYANLNDFEQFFPLFYKTYCYFPNNFLSYKTKAILHIKLLERKRGEIERERQRLAAIECLNQAMNSQPKDISLYKLLIIYSPANLKAKQAQQCLNKIINENIIIPRSELMFFMEEALSIKDFPLAKRFVDKTQEWYPQSRIVKSMQSYLDVINHKEGRPDE